MKASLNWINQYVKVDDLSPKEIASKMTFAGVECDDVHTLAFANNLVIGEIKTCIPHPDSDHLHVLTVDEGEKYGIHQIVCGAPNARAGLKVIVARVGAILPQVTIKASTIRGVESDGMCCALYELGVDKKYLSEKQVSGIEELPQDAPVGEENVLQYLGLDDTILDLDLLANRPDLYAISNIANEIGALYNRPVQLPLPKQHQLVEEKFEVGSITEKCPQFSIRIARGVKVKESPKWMKDALTAEGIRSINNVVDIGNYIMLLTGQPLNMYDLDKLPKASLIVRDDFEGNVKAMDGKEYPIQKEDLVVTSNGIPMCLAGTMTMESCMVDEKSTNIAIEAAVFDAARIRHCSNRIGLVSDSSMRFCKGINKDQAEYVQALTSDLLVDLAQAKSISKTIEYDTLKHEKKVIQTSLEYINGRLGTSFDNSTVIDILNRDHLEVKASGNNYAITIPSYRIDMDGEADISEEVIRLLGYENVQSTLPTTKLVLTGLTEKQHKKLDIRRYLRLNGVDEVLTYTLISKKQDASFAYIEQGEANVIKNPMTEERMVARRNLLPSLLECAVYNESRQNKDLALFEISDVDPIGKAGLHLGLVLTGNNHLWGDIETKPYDFYDAKGYLEGIMEEIGLNKARYQILPFSLGGEELHPGRSAEIKMGKTLIGIMGELHPNALKEYGLKNAVVLELDLATLLAQKVSPIKASIPSLYPRIERDLAFIIDKDVSYQEIETTIKRSDSLIKEVKAFDVYQGANILLNKKSIAVRLELGSDEKTLTDVEAKAVMDKAILAIASKLGGEIRQ